MTEDIEQLKQDNSEIGSAEGNMRSTKMGNKKIGKLIAEMSIPAILSMLVQSLYNVVDSIFVANITTTSAVYAGTSLGDDSFLAVSVVYPIMLIVNAVGVGIGVGANAYISRKLGEGNKEKASQAARTAIFMAIVGWLVIAISSFFLCRPFVEIFVNSSNATDVDYVVDAAVQYINIYMVFCIGFFMEFVGNRILQATGNMKVPMTCQLLGAVTNIALDTLFILVFGWGVLGAVLATIIGQWVAGAYVMTVIFTKKQDVEVTFKGFKVRKEYISNIVKVGVPAFFINGAVSLVTILLNNLLKDGNGVWILAAYLKIQTFVFMPMYGLMQGVMPILGYNYGANNRKRYSQALKISAITLACMMSIGLILFQAMPELIMRILTSNEVLLAEGAVAFRAISLSFYFAAVCVLIINTLQSTNCGIMSLCVSLTRQLIFLLPLAYLFYYLGGLDMVWYAYVSAEALSVLIFLPLAIRQVNKRFEHKQKQYDLGLVKVKQ